MDFALTEIEPMQSANCLLHSCIHSITKKGRNRRVIHENQKKKKHIRRSGQYVWKWKYGDQPKTLSLSEPCRFMSLCFKANTLPIMQHIQDT